MRPAILFVVTCALYATAPTANAQLYKWVDDSGVVNYGDWPPAGVKLQPVNRGTLSSVADRALVAAPARAPGAARNASRTDGPAANVRNEVLPSSAPASPGDANVDGTYAPYYDDARRPMAVEAATDRRRENAPVAKPLLPINPAIPDMPLRPRR
jgi:Domain of unknown function (DUF4124)